ncbi:MAG TPA: tRNA pseudouridine(38-40) synthase TruA [Bacillota bacterium]|nr:tRNA pseudouridine(38-40) synthase TruA [Bacillota bacterium]
MADFQRNLKLTVAYEGTHYAGFQKQAGNILTIQETLENAVKRITGEEVKLTGAGRTDSGVHARGQVVNFLTQAKLETEQWMKALNAVLPEDIAITGAVEVEPTFHARFSAKAKTYSYRIHTGKTRPVFNRNFVYFYRYQLDGEKMRKAAEQLIGRFDFRSFQAAGSSVKTTVRTVHFCRLSRVGTELVFEINADGFLYHMVRNIVGTLILVGNGKLSESEFSEILRKEDRSFAGPTAPALGLCLEEVIY